MKDEFLLREVRYLMAKVEQGEINQRLQKLIAFFDTEFFKSLDKDEQELLIKQREAMAEYNFILIERIKKFST